MEYATIRRRFNLPLGTCPKVRVSKNASALPPAGGLNCSEISIAQRRLTNRHRSADGAGTVYRGEVWMDDPRPAKGNYVGK